VDPLARARLLSVLLPVSLLAAAIHAEDRGRGSAPYSRGYWLAGDHHIHTMFSPDGMYPIAEQVAQAARHGLRWCVITDHGGRNHDRVALEQAYPALQEARKEHPEIVVFQGLEWNIPAAEHGGIILPVTGREAATISHFEARYDPVNRGRTPPLGNTEQDAIAGLRYLEGLDDRPLFFAHHPARRGLDSPHELRAWSDAAPNVARGMEGAPGHQAATLGKVLRGAYEQKPTAAAFPGYPAEAYRTHGGFDWFTSRVGGVWDSLLAEGRPWYITANSDGHRQYRDTRGVDYSTYGTLGHTTMTGRTVTADGAEFWPGEYTKTIVYAERPAPASIMEGLRAGRMFVVHGDLIDRLEFSVRSGRRTARMGETLPVRRRTQSVEVRIRLHMPAEPNAAGRRPRPEQVQLIAGVLGGRASDADRQEDGTARIAAEWTADRWQSRQDGWLEMRFMLPLPPGGAYLRVRGSNHPAGDPVLDSPTINPWDDLWFYSNPIFVRADL
jgi:hypothetical protein